MNLTLSAISLFLTIFANPIANADGNPQSKVDSVPTTDKDNLGVVFDFTDGDQVHGAFFMKADLVALAGKKVRSIPAKAFDGYWWSDGDHYRFSDINCTAK